ERDRHRHLELLPLPRRQREPVEGGVAVGHGAEPAAGRAGPGEQQRARPARAAQAAVVEVDDVGVLVADIGGAQLAPGGRLRCPAPAPHTGQDFEGLPRHRATGLRPKCTGTASASVVTANDTSGTAADSMAAICSAAAPTPCPARNETRAVARSSSTSSSSTSPPRDRTAGATASTARRTLAGSE